MQMPFMQMPLMAVYPQMVPFNPVQQYLNGDDLAPGSHAAHGGGSNALNDSD